MGLALQAALILGAYFSGSVPFGLIVARRSAGIDVRTVGSGNIGATNVGRAAGKSMGALVLALDALKAAVPALLGLHLASSDGGRLGALCGLAAFLGHCFPVFLRGRGGKGVSCALGALLVLAPGAAGVGALGFALGYGRSRIASVGSLAASVATGIALWVFAYSPATALAGTAMVLLIVLRHHGNIRRLIAGSEPRT
jgi:glycerol-3-phosphate acyltransferase PlsY